MELKLGKKEFVPDARDFKLKELLAVPMPSTPTRNFGYGTMFKSWGMLGNDKIGDCVPAGGDHETMMFNKLAGHPVDFTTDNTVSDYSAATGYVPGDPETDYGTEVREYYGYRRTTGVVDSTDTRHKIDAYVSIDPGDWDLMLRCTWTFGVTGIGFEVPESALEQFHASLKDPNIDPVWTEVGDTNMVGGHYVPFVGSTAPSHRATLVTWGKRFFMEKEFYTKHNDEAWIPLSREAMKKSGFNVRHIDWPTLSSMLDSL